MSKVFVGIPTRDRPEHLACLLSSLLFQEHRDFDVYIMDSGASDLPVIEHPLVVPFVDTLRGTGHVVSCIQVEVAGRSEVVAVNKILSLSKLEGYDFVYKIDDDHVLPPNALKVLCSTYRELSQDASDSPLLLSGVTPWMRKVFEGASSPYDKPSTLGDASPMGLTFVERALNGEVYLEIGHFHRYAVSTLAPTELASAANFFMKPDIRILWSDVGRSSKYADAMWFLQLGKLLNYQLLFLTGLNVWHVAALTGGVREETGNFHKESTEDGFRERLFAELYQDLEDAS